MELIRKVRDVLSDPLFQFPILFFMFLAILLLTSCEAKECEGADPDSEYYADFCEEERK